MRKTTLQGQQSCSVQKTDRKSTKYWKNETILKITHLAKAITHAKAIAFAKWSVRVKNYNCQKHAKNHSTTTAQLFCVKNGSKKQQILKKWDKFENRPSCKGYSPCKRPLQNGQFGSKIKNAKNIRKTILQQQHSCSVQKTARKSTKCEEKRRLSWKLPLVQRL